ncbi:hypothetical protein E2C01_054812 [Portunus trituberculatus]|uniref:Uncharacterized protein n=1 Tax=Portunus trituberculatus TaxID=210409 RepID=A0A5B7GT74_PORTR|nr:hypothetical protein [Portunus trituberculatus]
MEGHVWQGKAYAAASSGANTHLASCCLPSYCRCEDAVPCLPPPTQLRIYRHVCNRGSLAPSPPLPRNE